MNLNKIHDNSHVFKAKNRDNCTVKVTRKPKYNINGYALKIT